MKPVVNEIPVKYIQCPECDFEKNFLLKGEIRRGTFGWFCPKCNHFLMGEVDKDGILTDVRKGGRGGKKQPILLFLPTGAAPLSILFAYVNNAEETPEDNQPLGSVSTGTLLLEAETPDAETNPRGFPQYQTILF